MQWKKLLSQKRVRELLEPTEGKEKSGPDDRSNFDRDYDRVVFSTPVRRLQDKAQVFPLDPNDGVRTRLTHSMEVSTLSRGLVQSVSKRFSAKHEFARNMRDIERIAVTAGLVHDLGNPPFGHFGEVAVQNWFKAKDDDSAIGQLKGFPDLATDFLNFEGNARTLRLVCHLQVMADRYGLNLTAGTLSASMKYVASSSEALCNGDCHVRSKPGYLFSEKDIVEAVRDETGTGPNRNPIAFLVEAADDCVYSLCDLEDAIRKRVLSWRQLRDIKPRSLNIGTETMSIAKEIIKEAQDYINKRLRSSDLKLSDSARDDAYALMLRTFAAREIVKGAVTSFVYHYEQIMNGEFHAELLASSRSERARDVVTYFKSVGRNFIYSTRENVATELRGERVIHDLLNLFWKGISKFDGDAPKNKTTEGKAWRLLSESYRGVFQDDWRSIPRLSKEKKIPEAALKTYFRLLLLVDYVAGMTDSFACNLHRSLCNG